MDAFEQFQAITAKFSKIAPSDQSVYGYAYTTGFYESVCCSMFTKLPKIEQQTFLKIMEETVKDIEHRMVMKKLGKENVE